MTIALAIICKVPLNISEQALYRIDTVDARLATTALSLLPLRPLSPESLIKPLMSLNIIRVIDTLILPSKYEISV